MSRWFFAIFILSTSLIEARHVKSLPSALVVGTVYCDTCFQDGFSKASHFISGATVAVECRDGHSPRTKRISFKKQVKTDSRGDFKVHLPFLVSKHVNKIKGCSVKLVTSSEPYCAVASAASSSSLHLKSRNRGTHVFSAGFFTFKPLKQPSLCNQKPLNLVLDSQKSLPIDFPPPIQDPTTPDLPPLNNILPLPQLPFQPPVSSSNSGDKKPQQLFPPLLPPFVLNPNPLQPPPLLPNPFQPPPAPILPIFPPIPGFTPSPPPPPSLFPPLPFPPLPRIPGIPPASPKNPSP